MNTNSTTPRRCAGCNRNLADVVRTIAFNFDDLKTGGWRFEVCGSTPDCSDRLMLKLVTDVRRSNDRLRAENERLRALLDEAEGIVRDYSPGHTVWLDAVAAEWKP